MANYEAKTRTNYFALKSGKSEREFIEQIGAIGCQFSSNTDEDGIRKVGIYIEDSCPDELPAIIQSFLPDDDACIIMEIGSEKIKYLAAGATVVTTKGILNMDLAHLAADKAREALGNPNWTTRQDY